MIAAAQESAKELLRIGPFCFDGTLFVALAVRESKWCKNSMDFLGKTLSVLFVERRLPWRVQRWLGLLWLNNARYPLTKLRFLLQRPRFRVVISSHFVGGVGGSEKHLASLVDSMPDVEFYILGEDLHSNGFLPRKFNHYYVNKAKPGQEYDMYFYFCGGGKPPYVADEYEFRKKMVVTNAARITDIEDKFDHIAIQSENYPMFCSMHEKCIRVFPDVSITLPRKTRPVPNLPERYLLTVFNPFSMRQKRQDLLVSLAQASKLPIVWCYNDTTGVDFGDIPHTGNLVHMKNLAQEELFYLYEHADAYLSFAAYESFGWTLAEAYFMNKPIITRKTGIIDYVADEPGIHVYESEEQLHELLARGKFTPPRYDTSKFTDNTYAKVFEHLLAPESSSATR